MGILKKYWIEIGVVALILGTTFINLSVGFFDFREPEDRKQSRVFLAELRSALERYQIDQGIYPIHLGPAELGGAILYDALTPADRNYFKLQSALNNSEVIKGKRTFVDRWGNPIHYQCDSPTVSRNDRKTINPTYDLWSTASVKGDTIKDRAKWLTNWQSN